MESHRKHFSDQLFNDIKQHIIDLAKPNNELFILESDYESDYDFSNVLFKGNIYSSILAIDEYTEYTFLQKNFISFMNDIYGQFSADELEKFKKTYDISLIPNRFEIIYIDAGDDILEWITFRCDNILYNYDENYYIETQIKGLIELIKQSSNLDTILETLLLYLDTNQSNDTDCKTMMLQFKIELQILQSKSNIDYFCHALIYYSLFKIVTISCFKKYNICAFTNSKNTFNNTIKEIPYITSNSSNVK